MSAKLKSYHVEGLNTDEILYCSSPVLCTPSYLGTTIRNWNCGQRAVLTIRRNDQSWGRNYCALHARLNSEELQAEMIREEKKVEDKRTA